MRVPSAVVGYVADLPSVASGVGKFCVPGADLRVGQVHDGYAFHVLPRTDHRGLDPYGNLRAFFWGGPVRWLRGRPVTLPGRSRAQQLRQGRTNHARES